MQFVVRVCVLSMVCVCCVQPSVCFSNGSVSYSCDHMIPGHSSIPPSSLSPPFTVSVSSTTYRLGQTLTVTLTASGGTDTRFQGFLFQARSSDPNVVQWPIGSFINTDPAHFTTLHCNNRTSSAVSQASAVLRDTVRLTWEAPSTSSYGDIYFSASVVQNYATFWVKVNSSSVTVDSSASAAPSSSSSSLFIALLSVLGAQCRP